MIESWPFESLELAQFFSEAYSSLLLFFNTDTNSYTGKIAPDILKWLYIGSKYARMATCLFLKNQTNPDYRLRTLDLTGLPISNNLVKRLLTKNLYFEYEDSDVSNLTDLDDVSDFFSSEDDDLTDSCSNGSQIDSEVDRIYSNSLYNKVEVEKMNQKNFSWDKKSLVKLDLILPSSNLKEYFIKSLQDTSQTVNLELKINRLDLTIRDKKCCLINDNFDCDALVILFN